MANFQFKLLTGENPDAQYAAIPVKDEYTFYLLKNGKGYWGNTQCFGNGTTSGLPDINASFFNNVTTHTITAEEITNNSITINDATYPLEFGAAVANDFGLLFCSDDSDSDNTDVTYLFCSLQNMITNYAFTNSNTATVTETLDDSTGKKNIQINVNIADSEMIKTNESGISLNTSVVDDSKLSTGYEIASPSDKIVVTQKELVAYVNNAITKALEDVVKYAEDNGTI